MSVSLFGFDFVAPPPSVCFTLVYRNIDFLVLTLITCSHRQLSCPLSVYFDICDYLDSALCLFYNDFCLAPLNFSFTSLCNWVPSFTSPLPHITKSVLKQNLRLSIVPSKHDFLLFCTLPKINKERCFYSTITLSADFEWQDEALSMRHMNNWKSACSHWLGHCGSQCGQGYYTVLQKCNYLYHLDNPYRKGNILMR